MTSPTTTPTPRLDATVWACDDSRRIARVAVDQAIRLEDGEFLIRFPGTGCLSIARFTGRTRQCFGSRTRWGITCPTIERFTIDTVVIDGAIWGVRGAAIRGTWAIRPEAVTA